MKILAIIPARGGSKGIPKKNIRLMAGKPLITYAIDTAKACKYITDVYVSTDSTEIADIALMAGAKVIKRDANLAQDDITLDPVIYYATLQIEKQNNCIYDYVITMQPTSPLTSVATLDAAIKKATQQNIDTLISAVNKPHLCWQKDKEGNLVPSYKERKNRQQLPPSFFETGAFLIAKRNCITQTSRIGKNISIFEVPEKEAVDIDDICDWLVAENTLKKKKIVFCCDGYIELGMGHIYNCITLAYSMIEHDVLIVTNKNYTLGIKKIQESRLPYKTIENTQELFALLKEYSPDIFVNDKLDTKKDYILQLKQIVKKVITIEDLGAGAYFADAVINALYEQPQNATKKFYSGYKYVCLRDEFLISSANAFNKKVKNILVFFGGTDPSNLNKKLYQVAKNITKKYKDINFNFVTGIGYDYKKNGIITDTKSNIAVNPDVKVVTKYIKEADIAFSGQGRTIYELASMAVPTITISQNTREATHSFANMAHGFINLGLAKNTTTQMIQNTLCWLIDTPEVRKNMYLLMKKCPLKQGLKKVKDIILGEKDD